MLTVYNTIYKYVTAQQDGLCQRKVRRTVSSTNRNFLQRAAVRIYCRSAWIISPYPTVTYMEKRRCFYEKREIFDLVWKYMGECDLQVTRIFHAGNSSHSIVQKYQITLHCGVNLQRCELLLQTVLTGQCVTWFIVGAAGVSTSISRKGGTGGEMWQVWKVNLLELCSLCAVKFWWLLWHYLGVFKLTAKRNATFE